jgi:BirA family transcriptional regulator, biotin operon repressor / biotin---[acetyl-CoA-carboxylase] ligase
MIFSPFFSWIACIMALMIFEFFANRAFLFGFRLTNIDNCSNNQIILNDELRKAVYSYHSNTKFALLKNSNLLSHPGKQQRHSATFDNQLIELESVDSTNNYAMARIHEGMACDGMTFITQNQWGGKGQRGKNWLSEPGLNLTMSIVLEPGSLIPAQQFLFSAAIALGVLELVKNLKEGNWSIKWPNDIYWNDRKAAGILIENVIQGKKWPFSVVGIGINLNQETFPSEIPNAVSLKNITGKNYEPVPLAKEVVPIVQSHIAQLKKKPSKILGDFNQSLYRKNSPIRLKKGSYIFEATINGVDSLGLLLTDKGKFNPGEISVVSTLDGSIS